jgi:23S rRNA (uridine2552-2'-O)-methyltransferase
MARRKQKKNQWLEQQRKDNYTRQARQQGYRSRAVFKLQEIDLRDRLISRGLRVLELGAAPGGWSQYIAEKVGHQGLVVAVDLIMMKPLPNVHFIHGDFTDSAVQRSLVDVLGATDLVLSDLAPNITGIRDVDQARFLDLLDSALDLAGRTLRPGGGVLLKVFEGPEIKAFRQRCESCFGQVQVRKPAASRSKSREFYLLAKGYIGNQ